MRRLKLLSRITKLGHPIGNVATLPDEALENLAKQTAITRDERPRAGKGSSNRERRAIVRDCVAAIERFDSDGLNRILKRAVLEAGYTAVVRQVIAPLAQRLGELWSEGIIQTGAESYRPVIDELHVQLVEDFGAFQVALAKIRATRT